MKKNIDVIINNILEYEIEFKGYLLRLYQNEEEFKRELAECLNDNNLIRTIEYYRLMLLSYDNLNSSQEQRKSLKELILKMERFELEKII